MSPRFVTLKKFEKNFSNFLMGNVYNDFKIIPVQSLNVGLDDESVTFELKPVNEIQQPDAFAYWSTLVKLKSFFLILVPLFYIIVKNYVYGRFNDPLSLIFASLAMCFLFAGLNIRNDIQDHVSGFDRVNIPFTAKPILLGWASAQKLKLVSWIFFALSGLMAAPVLLAQAEEIRVVAVVFILMLLGKFLSHNSYKEKSMGEIILFILSGAGVASGYQVALGSGIDTECLAFGVLWGSVVLFLVHINNFSHLLTSVQAGIKNTMTNLGFDRAKNFLIFWWSMCLVLWFAFHWFFASFYWTWFVTPLLVFWSIPLFSKLSKIQSPVGSGLLEIRRSAHRTFLLMALIFFIENVWYLGTKLNWIH